MLFGLNESHVGSTAVKPTNLLNENYDFMAMEHELMAESAKSWNKVTKMVEEANCALIHESVTNPAGYDTLLEGAIKGFFTKVKEFFIKLKNMVAEMFQKFTMWLNSMIKSEKEFALKYEKEIMEKMYKLGEIEVKGYKYTNITTNIPDYTRPTITEETADGAKTEVDGKVAAYRKSVCGDSKDIAEDELSSALFEYYRDGEDAPVDLTLKTSDVKSIFESLKSFAKDKAAIEKDKAKIDKQLNDAVKELETAIKNADEADKEKTTVQNQAIIAGVKEMASIKNSAFAAKIAAVKEKAEFGKKVVLAVKSAKKESESTLNVGLFSASI